MVFPPRPYDNETHQINRTKTELRLRPSSCSPTLLTGEPGEFFNHSRQKSAINDIISRAKQDERNTIIKELGYPDMNKPMSKADVDILNKPIAQIVTEVQSAQLNPEDVLSTYTRKALRAHVETNCLTEILIESARHQVKTCNKNGPLAGVPVSLKDVSCNCLQYNPG